MAPSSFSPRSAGLRLKEALEDTPVVLVHGPRQCGKTTLAQMVGTPLGMDYLSFDDSALADSAANDPSGFVADLPPRVILDEIQKVPALFSAIKLAVDRDRKPGRFLLTGSANVLLLPKLSDSLAGRMEILRLHPMAQSELAGTEPDFLEFLFRAGFRVRSAPRLGKNLAERIAFGGYPAALARTSQRRRTEWYRNFIETLVQRDVRDLGRIAHLDILPRLLAATAAQTARTLNLSSLATGFQLSRPTLRDYVTLLERVFLLEETPPWHTNQLSRLIKTPKLHLGDTGLACAMLGLDADSLWANRESLGQFLETFVYQELRRQADWGDPRLGFHHFRSREGMEVDLVLERDAQELAGIEVKASGTVTAKDFRGLTILRDAAGARFKAGVVLYDGEACAPFGDRLFAVPIRFLWERSSGA